jgi:hypothetical protein
MPRNAQILEALVSSPDDVSEERNALEEVVRELNLTWSRTLGIRVELLRWETHTYLDFDTDPRAVINRQLPGDYDIFIGILWARFGTATGRAGSGTQEEFERAHSRHQAGEPLHIMVYLKDQPIAPYSALDPDQLSKVRTFAASLGPKGGLYSTFRSLEEFQTQVRIHLSRIIQEFGATGPRPDRTPPTSPPVPSAPASSNDSVSPAPAPVSAPASSAEAEEPGLIELFEATKEALSSLSESQARMSQSLDSLRERSEQSREEIQRLTAEEPQNVAAAKRIIGRTAEAMENYVARMNAELPIFSEALQAALVTTGQIATLSTESWPSESERVAAMLIQVEGFHKAMVGARQASQSFRDVIASTPRMTTQLNRARRRTVAVQDQLLEEFAAGERLAVQVEELLRNLVRSPS